MAPRVVAAIRHSAAIAAALSFVRPVFGQGWVAARRRALLFAVPIMLLLAIDMLMLTVEGRARPMGYAVRLVDPGTRIRLDLRGAR